MYSSTVFQYSSVHLKVSSISHCVIRNTHMHYVPDHDLYVIVSTILGDVVPADAATGSNNLATAASGRSGRQFSTTDGYHHEA